MNKQADKGFQRWRTLVEKCRVQEKKNENNRRKKENVRVEIERTEQTEH
jgi:hypothetical protein